MLYGSIGRRRQAPCACASSYRLVVAVAVAYGAGMGESRGQGQRSTAEPVDVLSGAVLLAIALSEEARGIRGLDVQRRSVDRAPPICS